MSPHRLNIEDIALKGQVVPYNEEYTSFGEFILDKLEQNPDLVGQIDAVTGEEYTYQEMKERSVRCALWLQSQGLRPRDFIVLCSNNQLDYAIACFAALYLGAIFSPWDITLNADNFCQRLNIIKPKMVFVNEASATVFSKAAKNTKLDFKIIVFGRVPGFLEFNSIITKPRIDEVKTFRCTPIESSSEIALVLGSSGTTGVPKNIALSHRALRISIRSAASIPMAGKVYLKFTIPHWINAVQNLFITFYLDTATVILPMFEEESACALIARYKGSWVYMTPLMINRFIRSDAVNKYDFSSLSEICYSSTPLPYATYRALKQRFPNIKITAKYGLTESSGAFVVQSTKSQPRSCGKIMANAQLKVIDIDTGRTLGANEAGEFIFKTTSMMSFYYGDPQATAKVLDKKGWIHSKDFGYYDENGEIFFIDRLEDMIRYKNDKISPMEIENVILCLPGVKEVAIVGQPHPQDGERPIAFVVRTENSCDTSKQITETEIIDFVAAELPANKQLRAGVRFVDHLPKTSTDKIRRTELRNIARSMVTI